MNKKTEKAIQDIGSLAEMIKVAFNTLCWTFIVIGGIMILLFIYIQWIQPEIQEQRCNKNPDLMECIPISIVAPINSDDTSLVTCYLEMYGIDNKIKFDNFEDALAFKRITEENLGEIYFYCPVNQNIRN